MEYFVDCGAALPTPVALPRLSIVEDSLSRTGSHSETSPDLATVKQTLLPAAQETASTRIMSWIDSSIMNMAETHSVDFESPTPPLAPREKPDLDQLWTKTKEKNNTRENRRVMVFQDGHSSDDETSETVTPSKVRNFYKDTHVMKENRVNPPSIDRDAQSLQFFLQSRVVSSETPNTPVKDPVEKDCLVPSPLRIRKPPQSKLFGGSTIHIECLSDKKPAIERANARFRPPRLPLRVIPASESNSDHTGSQANATPRTSPPTSADTTDHFLPKPVGHLHVPHLLRRPTSKDQPVSSISPADAAHIVRSNQGIAFLRETIFECVAELQLYVENVKKLQKKHRPRPIPSATLFWGLNNLFKEPEEDEESPEPEYTLGPSGELIRKETKEQRIARLRAEGWRTVGLRSPQSTFKGACYYQEFCNMVLNELSINHV